MKSDISDNTKSLYDMYKNIIFTISSYISSNQIKSNINSITNLFNELANIFINYDKNINNYLQLGKVKEANKFYEFYYNGTNNINIKQISKFLNVDNLKKNDSKSSKDIDKFFDLSKEDNDFIKNLIDEEEDVNNSNINIDDIKNHTNSFYTLGYNPNNKEIRKTIFLQQFDSKEELINSYISLNNLAVKLNEYIGVRRKENNVNKFYLYTKFNEQIYYNKNKFLGRLCDTKKLKGNDVIENLKNETEIIIKSDNII